MEEDTDEGGSRARRIDAREEWEMSGVRTEDGGGASTALRVGGGVGVERRLRMRL